MGTKAAARHSEPAKVADAYVAARKLTPCSSCQGGCRRRYLLAEAGDALVVTFMGTKQRRDLLTNANLILEPVWPEDVAAGPLPAVVSNPTPACRARSVFNSCCCSLMGAVSAMRLYGLGMLSHSDAM